MKEIIEQKADKLISMIKEEYVDKITRSNFIDKTYIDIKGNKYQVSIDVCSDGFYLSTLNLDRYRYLEAWEGLMKIEL